MQLHKRVLCCRGGRLCALQMLQLQSIISVGDSKLASSTLLGWLPNGSKHVIKQHFAGPAADQQERRPSPAC